MRIIFLLLFSLFISPIFSQNKVVLNYSQTIFDSDTCCWRKLAKLGEYQHAGELLGFYLNNGKVENSHSLNWHAGQVFAMGGNNRLALKYFKKTYNIFYLWFGGEDGKAWYYYAKGTVAFIKKDKSTLEKVINKWNFSLPKDLNYKVLELLYQNWDKTYLAAMAE